MAALKPFVTSDRGSNKIYHWTGVLGRIFVGCASDTILFGDVVDLVTVN